MSVFEIIGALTWPLFHFDFTLDLTSRHVSDVVWNPPQSFLFSFGVVSVTAWISGERPPAVAER